MRNFFRRFALASSRPTALRERPEVQLPTVLSSARGTGHVTISGGKLPVPEDRGKGGMPQFPGVDFQERGIELDDRAGENDAAIRASLIYFKHTWPNRSAVLTGSLAFRLRVWELAQELGVPIQGPHLISHNMPVRFHEQPGARTAKPSALASPILAAARRPFMSFERLTGEQLAVYSYRPGRHATARACAARSGDRPRD